jgi:putative transposase
VHALCEALGEPRATWYRRQKPPVSQRVKRPSPRRLLLAEEQEVLDTLNSEEFRDMAPAEVYATLLDLGRYVCSERTMYRVLERFGQSTVRYQTAPRSYAAPELLATRPNQVWSWDITKLRGPRKWTYYYLYVILDIYSRYVVGWMIADRELAPLAEMLIAEACLEHGISRHELTIHADNGAPMVAHVTAQLMANLGITKSHSRPHCSNDNPFSEAAFKTLKYRPGFPERFDSMIQARSFCRKLLDWYNNVHRHSGIAMLTPATVHHGCHLPILENRAAVLVKAHEQHPERFVRGTPHVHALPAEVWINKPHESTEIVVPKPQIFLSHSY